VNGDPTPKWKVGIEEGHDHQKSPLPSGKRPLQGGHTYLIARHHRAVVWFGPTAKILRLLARVSFTPASRPIR